MSKNSQQKEQEEEAFIAVPSSLSESFDDDEEESGFSWAEFGESCLLAILPCLLFVQFGVAYVSEHPPQIHWAIINTGIFAFIGSAVVFRRTFPDPESLVALVPEVLIDVILGLILFEKTEIAAAVMFGSIIGMGVVAAFSYANSNAEEEVHAEEYEEATKERGAMLA